MDELIRPTDDMRKKLTSIAQRFSDRLAVSNLNEEQIDSAIEELRPIRMWFHADQYGEAPGFRSDFDPPVCGEK